MTKNKTITVTQIKSAIRRPQNQKDWLLNLGIKKLHNPKVLDDTPANRGIVNKIKHLLRVED